MTDRSMTRRDWFRLKKPPQNRLLAPATSLEGTAGEAKPEVKALEKLPLPPNHDGMDLAVLPTLYEANLTWDQIADLIADIRDLTEDITLMQRSTASSSTAVTSADARHQLEAAAAALAAGRVNRIQVRYRWDGGQWIDTIQRAEDSFRLVRIRHNAS